MRIYELGSLFGLRVTAQPRALVGTLVLWALFAASARFVLRLPLAEALLGDAANGEACASRPAGG